jgi:hypothetical protein
VQCSITRCGTVQCSAVLRGVVQYSAVKYDEVWCSTLPSCVVRWIFEDLLYSETGGMLRDCHAVLYCIVLYCTVQALNKLNIWGKLNLW